jgi:hypothetical protein
MISHHDANMPFQFFQIQPVKQLPGNVRLLVRLAANENKRLRCRLPMCEHKVGKVLSCVTMTIALRAASANRSASGQVG